MRRRAGAVRLWSPTPLGLIPEVKDGGSVGAKQKVARAPAQDRVPLTNDSSRPSRWEEAASLGPMSSSGGCARTQGWQLVP